MLALRLTPEIEQKLETLACKTGRTKSYYAKLAIEDFLENQEDYFLAIERLREKLPAIPLAEVMDKLGIKEDDLES